MSSVAWLVTLPQKANRDGFTYKNRPSTEGFKPNVGRPIGRVRSSVMMWDVSLSFDMSMQQFRDFQTYFHTALGQGTNSIIFFDPIANANVLLTVEGAYSALPLGGGYFRVSFNAVREEI